MKNAASNAALRLVAGKLAEAIRPRNGDEAAPAPPAPALPKIFFADNSRLRPDNEDIRSLVELRCARHRVAAEWPSEHFLFPTGLTLGERKREGIPLIDRRTERAMPKAWRKLAACDAVVAEITPFRGPHMNPVVAFEIGIAVVHGIPIFAWSEATYRVRSAPSPHRLHFKDMLVGFAYGSGRDCLMMATGATRTII